MNYFSDTQEISSRFGDYIADLHDVFRCNDVDFGAPENFFSFARRLKYHSELRSDVLRVVKSVMHSGTNVSFRTILSVIAVSSGGSDVATSEREMSVPVKQVIEALIGAGAWNQADAGQPGLGPDVTAKVTETAPALESMPPGDGKAVDSHEECQSHEKSQGHEKSQEIGAVNQAENADDVLVASQESSSGGVMAVDSAEASGVPGDCFQNVADNSSVDSSIAPSIDEGVPSPPRGIDGSGGQSSDGQVGQDSDGRGSDQQGSDGRDSINNIGGSNRLAESTLAESLSRLELNALQLKIYLDSIDQRISRMEPRLENAAPLLVPTPPPHPREEAAVARFSAALASEASENAANSFGKEFQPLRTDAIVSNQQGGAATASSKGAEPAPRAATATDPRQLKFEHTRSGRRQLALPIFVGVGMLLLAASLFWRFGRETAPVVTLPANASADGGGNAAGGGVLPRATPSVNEPRVASAVAPDAASAGEPAGPGRETPSKGTPSRGALRERSAPGDTGLGEGRAAVEKPASPTKRSAQIPVRSPLRSSPAVAASMMANGTTEIANGSDSSSDDGEGVGSVPLPRRPVDVSAGVMAANLLLAPEPSYPKLATLTRTQGSVVMQAVISKEGTVEEVHVIKGHRLLRGAAKSAVRNWRYRPYKVDGVPVEVATTVSVDFNLHH
jgi:TonB family protein